MYPTILYDKQREEKLKLSALEGVSGVSQKYEVKGSVVESKKRESGGVR